MLQYIFKKIFFSFYFNIQNSFDYLPYVFILYYINMKNNFFYHNFNHKETCFYKLANNYKLYYMLQFVFFFSFYFKIKILLTILIFLTFSF